MRLKDRAQPVIVRLNGLLDCAARSNSKSDNSIHYCHRHLCREMQSQLHRQACPQSGLCRWKHRHTQYLVSFTANWNCLARPAGTNGFSNSSLLSGCNRIRLLGVDIEHLERIVNFFRTKLTFLLECVERGCYNLVSVYFKKLA